VYSLGVGVGVCVARVGIETVAMAAVVELLSSPSVPRSGVLAGEAVEVVRQVTSSFSGPLAVRGGEGRSGWAVLICFCCCCLWWSSSWLLRPAVEAWGAAPGGGAGVVVVDLGGAEPAGCLADAGSSCRGRTRSSSFGSVAWRRTASATFYMLERRPLPGGWRYGGVAVA
jgi:hypothetical protein